jgi:ribonuclease Z
MTVSAFEVDHFPVVPALGFVAEWRGHRVVMSGDTKKCDTLVRAASGADVLVSEVLHLGMMRQRIDALRGANNERMAEILSEACEYHSPTADVGAMARDAGVKKLVLTHIIPPPPNEGDQIDAIVASVRESYDGEVIPGTDLQRILIAEA